MTAKLTSSGWQSVIVTEILKSQRVWIYKNHIIFDELPLNAEWFEFDSRGNLVAYILKPRISDYCQEVDDRANTIKITIATQPIELPALSESQKIRKEMDDWLTVERKANTPEELEKINNFAPSGLSIDKSFVEDFRSGLRLNLGIARNLNQS
jgi:hypothetical protein